MLRDRRRSNRQPRSDQKILGSLVGTTFDLCASDVRFANNMFQVVDPLGTVIAQCSEEPGFVLAPIDLSLVKSVRQTMPLERHRRYDVYPKTVSSPVRDNRPVADSDVFQFGAHTVKGLQIFYRTCLCYAFTNIKCVLPGRILFTYLNDFSKSPSVLSFTRNLTNQTS